jgi:ribosome biogenesis protein UTP30
MFDSERSQARAGESSIVNIFPSEPRNLLVSLPGVKRKERSFLMLFSLASSIKFGIVEFHNATQLFNNLKTSLPLVVKCVKGGWDNIQSVHIKTSSSVSLPIWSCELSDSKGGRWDGLTAVPADASNKQSDEEEEKDGEADEEVVEAKKGKKRQLAAEEQPQKKKKIKNVEESAKPKTSTTKNHPPMSKPSKKIAQTHTDPSGPTKTKTVVAPHLKREKKPRPSAADFLESNTSSLPDKDLVSKSSISTTVAEQPAKKKRNTSKLSADTPRDPPTSETASKHAVSVPAMKAKDAISPTKTKAVASGIDKKKAKLTSQTTKSKLGQAGRGAKNALLRKKAAAP